MSTRLINNIIFIQYKFDIRKQTFEGLIMRMTKSHVPERLNESRKPRNIIADLRWKSELRSLSRIDGVNTTFTLALVENFPHGQGLNWKNIFIKIVLAIIIMIEFINRSKIWCNWRDFKYIIELKIRERGWNKGCTYMCRVNFGHF